MGIELISRDQNGRDLNYNWEGWRFLQEFASKQGIDADQITGSNNGDTLSAAICHAVANAIESQPSEYNKFFAGPAYGPAPAKEHARIWRESSGFEQR
jgi:hypothetical protein